GVVNKPSVFGFNLLKVLVRQNCSELCFTALVEGAAEIQGYKVLGLVDDKKRGVAWIAELVGHEVIDQHADQKPVIIRTDRVVVAKRTEHDTMIPDGLTHIEGPTLLRQNS